MGLKCIIVNAIASSQDELLITYHNVQLSCKHKDEPFARIWNKLLRRCVRLKHDSAYLKLVAPHFRRHVLARNGRIERKLILTLCAHNMHLVCFSLEKVAQSDVEGLGNEC